MLKPLKMLKGVKTMNNKKLLVALNLVPGGWFILGVILAVKLIMLLIKRKKNDK
jgi:hypothetical protein